MSTNYRRPKGIKPFTCRHCGASQYPIRATGFAPTVCQFCGKADPVAPTSSCQQSVCWCHLDPQAPGFVCSSCGCTIDADGGVSAPPCLCGAPTGPDGLCSVPDCVCRPDNAPEPPQLPRIARSLGRPDEWSVYEPDGRFVAYYRSRKRARRWMVAAGFERWREESWEQLRSTGTPRATSHIAACQNLPAAQQA